MRQFRGWVIRNIAAHPTLGLSAIFLAGIFFWGGINWGMEATNTESFCISCHAMKEYVYKEYKETTHYSNRTGIRASCPDCHVPQEWERKFVRKIQATNELYHWLMGSIDLPASFEAKRLSLAQGVWAAMEESDSRECRNCHGGEFMSPEAQTNKARAMHALAESSGKTCIDCHKGIAHTLPQDFDTEAMQDDLHELIDNNKLDCGLCHEGVASPPPDEQWDE